MKNSIIRFTLTLITAIALTGCGDEINPTGTISGYAFLCDTLGRQLPNSAGITVTIDNTTRSAHTDSLGHYVFSAVPKGIYSISFSKKGFANNKYVNLQFIGKDEYVVGQDEYSYWSSNYYGNQSPYWSQNLYQLPTINSISHVEVLSNPETDSVTFTGSTTSTMDPDQCKLFLSKNHSVSSAPDRYDVEFEINNFKDKFQVYIPKRKLVALGYKPGQTLYAILYPACSISTSYKDIKTNKPVYTSLGTPSPVLSFKVPE